MATGLPLPALDCISDVSTGMWPGLKTLSTVEETGPRSVLTMSGSNTEDLKKIVQGAFWLLTCFCITKKRASCWGSFDAKWILQFPHIKPFTFEINILNVLYFAALSSSTIIEVPVPVKELTVLTMLVSYDISQNGGSDIPPPLVTQNQPTPPCQSLVFKISQRFFSIPIFKLFKFFVIKHDNTNSQYHY